MGLHSLSAMSCNPAPSSVFTPSSSTFTSRSPRHSASYATPSQAIPSNSASALHAAFQGLHRHQLFSRPSAFSLSHAEAFLEASDREIGSPITTRNGAGGRGRRAVVSAVFERFTERAIKAVMLAQAEAKVLGRKEVATEQLLLGLIAEDFASSGKPGGYLGSGMTIGSARDAVAAMIKDGRLTAAGGLPAGKPASEVPFSSGSKRVFEKALEESRKHRHSFIAPEHLAVALMEIEHEGAGLVIDRLGVKKHRIQQAALARLKGELDNEGRSSESISNPSSRPAPSSQPRPASAPGNKARGKKAQQSALEQFCTDLTAMAVKGEIDPVIGREGEVARVVQILARRTKNNPLLMGEPGVGKTAIAEGLALRIAENNVPPFLQGKRLLSLDMGRVMAGAKERGELELRVTSLVAEAVAAAGEVVMVIDEVHMMVGAGAVGRGRDGGGSGLDIANLLKPALSRGLIQCIATTTTSEYRKHLEKDKALTRRFQPVTVDEPSEESTLAILHGLRHLYEAHHKCTITDAALAAAVSLSSRYIPDRFLPDKAIDLIDEAASREAIEGSRQRRRRAAGVLHEGPGEYWREIRMAQAAHDAAHARQNPFTSLTTFLSSDSHNGHADTTTAADAAAAAARSKGAKGHVSSDDNRTVEITPEHIASVASHWTGIPLQQLTTSEQQQLSNLEETLEGRVVGQEGAVRAIARAVQRARVGLKEGRRPVAALLFSGPTGVGKSELCRALAASYYGSEDSMIRLDMSEYMERHAVSKLIGAPPGYVGYGEGGKLTEAVRRQPFCLILMDEIEKAHPDVFNLLLQIFEDGRLTDSQGRHVSFKNALIVMTSNVGSQAIARGSSHRIGFLLPSGAGDGSGRGDGADGGRYAAMREVVMEELKGHFRPELMNRIDEVVVFRPLEREQIRTIANMMVKESADRLAKRRINLEVSEALMEKICEEGYDRAYGARPLRRAVTRLVDDPISEAVLAADGNSSSSHASSNSKPSESLPSVPSVLLPKIVADVASTSAHADISATLNDIHGVREGAFTAGDTALVDVGADGEPVVIRLPRPDVCEMGLCLPILKLPAPVTSSLSLPD